MSKADEIMDVLINVLEQSGYKLEDVHLINFDTWKGIEKDMSIALSAKGLDLSYTSDYSDKYEIKLAGNFSGIINSFRYAFKNHPKYGWREANIQSTDIEYAKDFYEEDRYGYARKITKERFISLLSSNKNETRHIGIGSQSSIIDTTISVYRDAENNLMYNKSTLIYD